MFLWYAPLAAECVPFTYHCLAGVRLGIHHPLRQDSVKAEEGGRRKASGSDVPLLLVVLRYSRAALAGDSWGMSVGSVSGGILGSWAGGSRAVQAGASAQPIFAAVCEGNSTCSENEVCVRPGECRCRHGYFGANCDTSERGARRGWVLDVWRETREIKLGGKIEVGGPWGSGGGEGGVYQAYNSTYLVLAECPRQFWGPDCKERCSCHPHGQCEDVTGQCTCHARRWGARCEHACQCQHGTCHPRSGACRCEPGWWGAQCASACYCSATSRCDPQTGACLCHAGWWGRSCNNQCACNSSPCEQQSGRCQCRERTFGARCDRYCQCFRGRCHPVDGTCACDPGYRGKYCREPCPAGFYGLGCRRR